MNLSSQDDVEKIALRLVERAVDVYDIEGSEIVSRWYHSGQLDDKESRSLESLDQADCMIWTNKQNVLIRFQLNVLGQVVDWNVTEGLRSGLIVEFEVEDGQDEDRMGAIGFISPVEKICFDSVLNKSAVNLAISIVQGMCHLDSTIQAATLDALSSVRLHSGSIPPNPGQAPVLVARPEFWSRIRRWALG